MFIFRAGRKRSNQANNAHPPSPVEAFGCVGDEKRIFVSERACDPQSDLEKLQHQSGDSWQLGNTLHGINNFPCASCMHNYKAVEQKHEV